MVSWERFLKIVILSEFKEIVNIQNIYLPLLRASKTSHKRAMLAQCTSLHF